MHSYWLDSESAGISPERISFALLFWSISNLLQIYNKTSRLFPHTTSPHSLLPQVFFKYESQLDELYRNVHRYKDQGIIMIFSVEWIRVDYSSFGLALKLLSLSISGRKVQKTHLGKHLPSVTCHLQGAEKCHLCYWWGYATSGFLLNKFAISASTALQHFNLIVSNAWVGLLSSISETSLQS